jgi:hypothetical protein
LAGTLKPVNLGNSTGPLSVRFVFCSDSGGSDNSTGTGDGDENADALTNGAQSSVMPNSLFAMAIASAFAYLL